MPLPDLDRLALALGNSARWRMLKELSGGESRTIAELAKVAGCSYDSGLKHLGVLAAAGIVVKGRGYLYQIPAHHLPVPGERIVDCGHCLLRLDAAAGV